MNLKEMMRQGEFRQVRKVLKSLREAQANLDVLRGQSTVDDQKLDLLEVSIEAVESELLDLVEYELGL